MELPPTRAWHIDHGILPQEIIERSTQIQLRYDRLGTKRCGRCCRELHQDSFSQPFEKWIRGQICHTCVEAKQFLNKPSRTARFEEISFPWFKEFKERRTGTQKDEQEGQLYIATSPIRSWTYDLDDDYWCNYDEESDYDSDFDRRALD